MTSHRIIKDVLSSGDFSAESYNAAESIADHCYSAPQVQEIISLDASWSSLTADLLAEHKGADGRFENYR